MRAQPPPPASAWVWGPSAVRGRGATDRTAGGLRANPDDSGAYRPHTDVMLPSVLVVDDHAGFRTVARAMLEGEGFTVVGEAADGSSAVEAADRLRPFLVLLDVHLPDIDGFTVCERLAHLSPAPVVVLTSSRPMSDLRQRLAGSLAAGFVAKDELSGAALLAFAG